MHDTIKAKILSGSYKDGQLLPSEREIGELHQVDRTTVRKALKMLVDENLVIKLPGIGTKVARNSRLNESRNDQSGRSISAKPRRMMQGTIGFFLPPSVHRTDRISQPFYSTLFYHTERECRDNGYACYYSTLDEQDNFEDTLRRQHFDGIIFVSNSSKKFIQMALDEKIPSVLVNEYNPNLLSYIPDNINGMISMCDYLVGLGHRRFALITGIPSYLTSRERMIGCSYALSKHGVGTPYVASCDWEPDTAYRISKELLSTVDMLPTAIVGFNDNIAIGCLRAASELGLRVPQDITIVGFDDVEQSRYSIPAITTVHIGITELAQAAVQGLFFQMHKGGSGSPTRSYVPSSLVIRGSSAPPPKSN